MVESTTPRSAHLKSTWMRFDDCLAHELAPVFNGPVSTVLDDTLLLHDGAV